MEPKRILFIASSIILTFQLVLLQPSLPVAVTSQGAFTSALQKITVVQQKVSQTALFVSKEVTQSDTVIFVGDIMLGRNVEHLMQREGSDYPFLGFDLVQNYPQAQVVGNFEASMSTKHVQTPAYAMRFSVDRVFLPALRNADFTHLSLANNHSFDNGIVGYENARTLLQENNQTPFGNGLDVNEDSIAYLNTTKGKIALIGINATQRIPSDEELARIFTKASRHSSFQVAYIHWGNEYEPNHSNTQRLLAEILVDAGADLIVGHHPHVVQDVDLIKGVIVFYSLGNYIFDQYFSKEVQEGLVIGLDLQNAPAITLTPITSAENLSQPRQMLPGEYQKFLNELSARSHPSLKNKIEAGYIPLLDMVATSTKVAMM